MTKSPKKVAVKPAKKAAENPATKKVTRPAAAALPALDAQPQATPPVPAAVLATGTVLDRLWATVDSRRLADPRLSHSARLLSRGTAKVAQKFGEEAVECVIEAITRNTPALIGESADVLYHLMVLWVDAGLRPEQVWAELERREGISGIVEKASRPRALPAKVYAGTRKIP